MRDNGPAEVCTVATRIIHVNSDRDVAPAAEEGAKALRKGKLVGFPTETVYGVAALATHGEAMERLRELKSRPARPFSVHLGRPKDARRYVRNLPDAAERLIRRAWPGPVTLLVSTAGQLADGRLRRRKGLHERLCYRNTIGLRCPDEPVAAAMLSRIALPVVAPSANLAGGPSPRSAEDVAAELDGRIDLLLDAGPTRHGADSTIVRYTAKGWRVVREGVLDAEAVGRMTRRTILFVCTGNTCRSPMAEGIARKALADRLGCSVRKLEECGYVVRSAGLFGGGGGAASDAVAAARAFGADISRHRSRPLTNELIRQADLVFCMTGSHVADVLRMAPDAQEKVRRMDPRRDVADPIGGGPSAYRRAAKQIAKAFGAALDKGLP